MNPTKGKKPEKSPPLSKSPKPPKPKKPETAAKAAAETEKQTPSIPSDVLGSYTGIPTPGSGDDVPEQDADDL